MCEGIWIFVLIESFKNGYYWFSREKVRLCGVEFDDRSRRPVETNSLGGNLRGA